MGVAARIGLNLSEGVAKFYQKFALSAGRNATRNVAVP
jgi:hypothetical protein